jgi:PBP1b-binding outer membrane lipoprotein LpoB
MFLYGTSISRLCYLVLATLFVVSFVSVSDAVFEKGFFASGNTLWDELYQKCGDRVSFHCVQSRLMNYINNTLDSDLRITDGIYFVKSNNDRIDTMIDTNSHFEFTTDNKTTLHRRRTEKASKNITNMNNNEISNTTSKDFTHEEDEEAFGNFVKTVEKIEDDLEASEKRQNNLTIEASNFTSNVSQRTIENEDDEEPRSDSLVIKSLNKVSEILYEKTSGYLSSHDLQLDLPQTFFKSHTSIALRCR